MPVAEFPIISFSDLEKKYKSIQVLDLENFDFVYQKHVSRIIKDKEDFLKYIFNEYRSGDGLDWVLLVFGTPRLQALNEALGLDWWGIDTIKRNNYINSEDKINIVIDDSYHFYGKFTGYMKPFIPLDLSSGRHLSEEINLAPSWRFMVFEDDTGTFCISEMSEQWSLV